MEVGEGVVGAAAMGGGTTHTSLRKTMAGRSRHNLHRDTSEAQAGLEKSLWYSADRPARPPPYSSLAGRISRPLLKYLEELKICFKMHGPTIHHLKHNAEAYSPGLGPNPLKISIRWPALA